MSEELRPIGYQGLGRMIETLIPSNKFLALAGEKIASVGTTEDKDSLVFGLVDGRTLTYMAMGDCCSGSWIEHLTVPPDIAGAEVISCKEVEMGEFDDDGETIRVYQTAFQTGKGEIVVEYRNASNGNYGGWLLGPVEDWAYEKERRLLSDRRAALRELSNDADELGDYAG
ncbi:MAG: hypothetical protein M0Z95_04440 [Actinomycetota bacterium]|nr:hypothetical protein [Actinomycetota bacterium]